MPESISHPASPVNPAITTVDKLAIQIMKSGDPGYQQLKDKLEKKHPEYIEMLPGWQQAGDVAFNRIRSGPEKAHYLVMGLNEDPAAYGIRIKLSAFSPETPQLMDDLTSTLFSQQAVREVNEGATGGDTIQAFIDAAGRQEEPLEGMSRQAIEQAMTYNRVDGFLDYPKNKEAGVPYLTLIPPFLRFDWDTDEKGKLIWVKYYERYIVKEAWDAKPKIIDEYRIVTGPKRDELAENGVGTPGAVEIYRVITQEGEAEKIEGPERTEHKFHDLPVRELWWKEKGEAWAKTLTELDIKVFRLESDLNYDIFDGAHVPLKAWIHAEMSEGDADGQHMEAVRRIHKGTDKVIHLNPGDSDRTQENVERMDYDVSLFEYQSQEIDATRQRIKLLAGSGTESVQETGALGVKSGIALSIEAQQKEKPILNAAKVLSEWEWQLLELVLLEGEGSQEIEREDIINLAYPNSFDQRQLDQLAELMQVSDNMGSKELSKHVRQAAAAKMTGSGVTTEVMDTINMEIEQAINSGVVGLSEDEKSEREMENQASLQAQKNQPEKGDK